MISRKKITSFQKHILDWYSVHKRDLPWRELPFDTVKGARDPYKILVSEIMSQQTQLSRVIPKYEAWVKKFPSTEHLAQAKTAEVLHYWNGLGYNRRALHLKKTAEIIAAKYHGEFPRSEKELMILPGIGKYTARAILCFAFDQQVAVVDTNVRKVILTQFAVPEKEIAEIADALLPQGSAYNWNQALMDYAASVLKKEKISIPKQSQFIGSHRYYRGQVLKLLLQKRKVPVDDVGFLIKKDYTDKDKKWLLKLLEELEKEGFIIANHNLIELVA
ncbi:MAG TPA: hypothetical protein VND99_04205 [Candidatus Acidoferrales bacterium]|nr:hypothetical protein [Candidatus Acidoferrales bacterium]